MKKITEQMYIIGQDFDSDGKTVFDFLVTETEKLLIERVQDLANANNHIFFLAVTNLPQGKS